MSDQEKQQIQNKNRSLWILLFLILLSLILGVAYYLTTHISPSPVIVVGDQKQLIDQIKRIKSGNDLRDSAVAKRARRMSADSAHIAVVKNQYRQMYLNAMKMAPDTCKSYIKTIYAECGKGDSLKDMLLLSKDSTIKDQRKRIDSTDLALYKTNQIIDIKNDSLAIVNGLYIKYRNKFRWAKGIGWVKTAASGYLGYKAGKLLP